jgi:hypothetical protein
VVVDGAGAEEMRVQIISDCWGETTHQGWAVVSSANSARRGRESAADEAVTTVVGSGENFHRDS